MVFCSNCGKELSDRAKFCRSCGAPAQGEMTGQRADTPNDGAPSETAGINQAAETPMSEDGIRCARCGEDVEAGKRFCGSCGEPVQSGAAVRCGSCGAKVQNGEPFCGACGAPVQGGEDVRCIKCGNVIEGGKPICPLCGERALTKQEYDAKVAQGNFIHGFRKKHGIAAFTFGVLAVLLFALILCLVLASVPLLSGGNKLPAEEMGKVFAILLLAAPPSIWLIWFIARRTALRRAKTTPAEYRRLRLEYAGYPKTFFYPIVKIQFPQKPGKKPAKYTRKQIIRQRVFAVTMLVAVLGLAGVMVNMIVNGTGDAISADQKTASGVSLSGRWEGQVASNKSGGLEQIDAPAIVFQGGTAYFGSSMNNNADIISECKAWNKGIATYKAGNGKITFTMKGQTQTYSFDGTTIYYNGYKLKRAG